MVKDIKIEDVKMRKVMIFQDIPEKLAFVIFKMLDNWNKTPDDIKDLTDDMDRFFNNPKKKKKEKGRGD